MKNLEQRSYHSGTCDIINPLAPERDVFKLFAQCSDEAYNFAVQSFLEIEQPKTKKGVIRAFNQSEVYQVIKVIQKSNKGACPEDENILSTSARRSTPVHWTTLGSAVQSAADAVFEHRKQILRYQKVGKSIRKLKVPKRKNTKSFKIRLKKHSADELFAPRGWDSLNLKATGFGLEADSVSQTGFLHFRNFKLAERIKVDFSKHSRYFTKSFGFLRSFHVKCNKDGQWTVHFNFQIVHNEGSVKLNDRVVGMDVGAVADGHNYAFVGDFRSGDASNDLRTYSLSASRGMIRTAKRISKLFGKTDRHNLSKRHRLVKKRRNQGAERFRCILLGLSKKYGTLQMENISRGCTKLSRSQFAAFCTRLRMAIPFCAKRLVCLTVINPFGTSKNCHKCHERGEISGRNFTCTNNKCSVSRLNRDTNAVGGILQAPVVEMYPVVSRD